MSMFISPIGCKQLVSISLPDPREGKLRNYLYDEHNICLYELTRFSDQFKSWFADNHFDRRGQLDLLTRVDPLYLFLPHIIKLASKQFRTIQDICATCEASQAEENPEKEVKFGYALTPTITWNSICDSQEVDGELYIRYSASKTLVWLRAKHKQLLETLERVMPTSSKATLTSYATDLLNLYISPQLDEMLRKSRESSGGLIF